MATLFDYLAWRGDLSFEKVEFCEVDNLIFAELSFIDFDQLLQSEETELTLAEAAKRYAKKYEGQKISMGVIVPNTIPKLFVEASKTIRYRDVRVVRFVNEIDTVTQIQFSAAVFVFLPDQAYIAFRGTDDTLIGWKENLNMGFLPVVPAQRRAAAFITDVALSFPGHLYVGGHSKGGNLSVYGASNASADAQARILHIYSNDGPGYQSDFLQSPGYLRMRDRITTILPQNSIVGRLLEHEDDYEVVRSTQKGLYQHDGFSWEVMGDHFIRMTDLTAQSKRIDHTVRTWIAEMDESQREAFVDALYEILSASSAQTLSDIAEGKLNFIKSLWKVDAQKRQMVVKTLKRLSDAITKDWFYSLVKPSEKNKKPQLQAKTEKSALPKAKVTNSVQDMALQTDSAQLEPHASR